MKLGYPTHPRRSLVSEIDWIGRNGFDFVDLFLEPESGAIGAFDPLAVRDSLKSWNLPAVGHLAWYLPIGSPVKELRRAALDVAVSYFQAFETIGVKRATIHAHWASSSLFSTDESLAWQIETLADLIHRAAPHGLQIMYEPVGMAAESRENLDRLLQALPDLGFHLDIGHFHLNQRQPADFIRHFASRLVHVHLHDNDGSRDQHLPPGIGTIDWDETLTALKECYDDTVTLEVFTPERDYVLLARDWVRRKWAGIVL